MCKKTSNIVQTEELIRWGSIGFVAMMGSCATALRPHWTRRREPRWSNSSGDHLAKFL